jgi:hypothetical protein
MRWGDFTLVPPSPSADDRDVLRIAEPTSDRRDCGEEAAMDERAVDSYVTQVADGAERTLCPPLNRALLEAYAREAVLDLWLHDPGITIEIVELALDRIRFELIRRSALAA